MDVSTDELSGLESCGAVAGDDGLVGVAGVVVCDDGLVVARLIVAGAGVDSVASVVDAQPPANSSVSAQLRPHDVRRTSVALRVDESTRTTLRTDAQHRTLVW